MVIKDMVPADDLWKAMEPPEPVAFALIDLDDFAEINTSLGHEAGDRVLRSFERTLTGSVPKEAVISKLGGDEWGVALPGTSAEGALILLEEIRSHWSSRYPDPKIERKVSLSVGIAARPPHAVEPADLRQAADGALMRAKREGRGRVAIYVDEKMVLKSNYYNRAQLDRLSKLSDTSGRTEASLLREALDDLFAKYPDDL